MSDDVLDFLSRRHDLEMRAYIARAQTKAGDDEEACELLWNFEVAYDQLENYLKQLEENVNGRD